MMDERTITTRKGPSVRVLEAGDGEPLVFLHGAGGLLDSNPFLDMLAAERFHVYAPELPGYGESTGEELLEDMLDFTLHGLDVLAELGLERANVIGHSMGGMIAAEIACVCPGSVGKLVLVNPAGLWLDEHPIPDIFGMLPFQLGDVLFADPAASASILAGGVNWSDPKALQEFFVGNARRLGTAGKLLFPVPNRRLSKRLYRLRAETLVLWGEADKLIVPAYAARWKELVPHAEVATIAGAGHMTPYEQPDELVAQVVKFLA